MSETITIPGYRIEKQLGQGGMASVYLAIQESFERQVALKIMSPTLDADPSFATRFMREARIVANLSHASIVPVFEVGEYESYHYLSMEYLPAGDLKTRILDGERSVDLAVDVVMAVCAALDLAHRKGFVHRDIKPENILFREDGTPVLTDFGIARALDSGRALTTAGVLVGTPNYMSPEQAKGQEIDGRSDLYSMGVVFYEILTGDVPFHADSSLSLALKHVSEPIPPLPSEFAGFQDFLDRLTAKDPDARFATGADVIRELRLIASRRSLVDRTLVRPSALDTAVRSVTPETSPELESTVTSVPEDTAAQLRGLTSDETQTPLALPKVKIRDRAARGRARSSEPKVKAGPRVKAEPKQKPAERPRAPPRPASPPPQPQPRARRRGGWLGMGIVLALLAAVAVKVAQEGPRLLHLIQTTLPLPADDSASPAHLASAPVADDPDPVSTSQEIEHAASPPAPPVADATPPQPAAPAPTSQDVMPAPLPQTGSVSTAAVSQGSVSTASRSTASVSMASASTASRSSSPAAASEPAVAGTPQTAPEPAAPAPAAGAPPAALRVATAAATVTPAIVPAPVPLPAAKAASSSASSEERRRRLAEERRKRRAQELRQIRQRAAELTAQANTARIHQLLALARQNIAAGALWQPAGACAADRYRAIFKIRPSQPEALAGAHRLASVLAEEAGRAESAADIFTSILLIKQVSSLQPDNPQLPELQSRLLQIQAHLPDLDEQTRSHLDRAARDIARAQRALGRTPLDGRAADDATREYDRAAAEAPMAPGLPSLQVRLVAAYAMAVQTELSAHDVAQARQLIAAARRRSWSSAELDRLAASIPLPAATQTDRKR